MGSDVTAVSADETLSVFALDTREISLDELSENADSSRKVAVLIGTAAERSRIQVAGFYSSI
jgi:hypothetical protein